MINTKYLERNKVVQRLHNTIGDVVLTNMSRETSYFYDFVQYPKKVSLASDVLSMFLNFGQLSASRSYKKGSYSYFKKGCHSQWSILEPKETVKFKQHN